MPKLKNENVSEIGTKTHGLVTGLVGYYQIA